MQASSNNGNESPVDEVKRRRRLTRLLYVGLALVAGGFVYRIVSMVTAFSTISRKTLSSEKQDALSDSISSAAYADYVMAAGALLAIACVARLFVSAFGRKEPR